VAYGNIQRAYKEQLNEKKTIKKSSCKTQGNNLKNKVIPSGKTCYMHVQLIIGTKHVGILNGIYPLVLDLN
jgi:hypothetical protein